MRVRIAEKTHCSVQTWSNLWMWWETTESKKVSVRWYRILKTCFIKNLQRLRESARCLQHEKTWNVSFSCVFWMWQSSRQQQWKHRTQFSIMLRCWRLNLILLLRLYSNKSSMKSQFYDKSVCLLTEKRSNQQKLWKLWTQKSEIIARER